MTTSRNTLFSVTPDGSGLRLTGVFSFSDEISPLSIRSTAVSTVILSLLMLGLSVEKACPALRIEQMYP